METNNNALSTEQSLERHLELTRSSCSRNLNQYLRKIKTSDPFKNKVKEASRKEPFNQDNFPFRYYDTDGKIDWEIISLIMPFEIEKTIKREYPMLCENEIRLCCLLIFDVPFKFIPNILKYNKKSIYPTQSKIKQKAKIKNIKEMFRKININFILTAS